MVIVALFFIAPLVVSSCHLSTYPHCIVLRIELSIYLKDPLPKAAL
jgi:hypothetical protein